MTSCESIQEKLSAYLDGELTQQDSQMVAAHLRTCARCRLTYDDFTRLRGDVGKLQFPQPPAEEWRAMMSGFGFRATRGIGWLLWGGGAVVLAAYGIYAFATDPAVEAIKRICVLAVILGIVLVFMTVLAERIVGYSHDKYKDVEK